jgi:PPOX class probable F420-dependent enzyme
LVTTELSTDALQFVADRHLAMLSTVARDGTIHQVAVGFTVHDGVVRIITSDGTQKVRNVERDARATVGQVDGARWISFVGTAVVERERDAVAFAEKLYAERYRQPRPNPQRVVIRIAVDSVLGSSGMRAAQAASAPSL